MWTINLFDIIRKEKFDVYDKIPTRVPNNQYFVEIVVIRCHDVVGCFNSFVLVTVIVC